MSLFEDAMSVAVQLPVAERERLATALGLKLAPKTPSNSPFSGTIPLGNLAADRSKTDPQGWRKAETGHAVLDTGGKSGNFAPGADSLRGIWAHLDLPNALVNDSTQAHSEVSRLPKGSPVLVDTSAVLALALDLPDAREFWSAPPVEIRLATATYLKLLESCENAAQCERVRAFVEPFAVLSLGPMASSKSVQLMFEGGAQNGLSALDALVAATALAHEIPLVTRAPRHFTGLSGLQIAVL